MQSISDAVFRRAIEANYLSHAWALRWKKLIPAYVEWQRARESAGWRWLDGEIKKQKDISLLDGRTLTIHGRLDRIDQNQNDKTYAVLDYKTQGVSNLKDKLSRPGEDVQLAIYSALLNTAKSKAAYLSLDKDKPGEVGVEGNIDQLSNDVVDRLGEIFVALYEGAMIKAQGAEEACIYCEMRGLCRKDYWA